MIPALISIACLAMALVWWLYRTYPWLAYDLVFLKRAIQSFRGYKAYIKQGKTIVDILEDRIMEHPNKNFIVFRDKGYSYKEMGDRMNKLANAAHDAGWKCGDVAALMMKNEASFVAVAYGMMKCGVQSAFINTNQRRKSLLHSFKVSDAKIIIVGQDKELFDAILDIKPALDDLGAKIYVFGGAESEDLSLPDGFQDFQAEVDRASDKGVPKSRREGVDFSTPAWYIYTSGTTGLPKAAVVTHSRMLKITQLLTGFDVGSNDVIYSPLPLYHSASSLIALGIVIHLGATFVTREKFSATQFWEDCRRNKVTCIQYIGELCRYLLAQPKKPSERNHQVKMAFGNGLRQDIWKEFQDRFNIPQIVEYYGSTEGNAGFINYFNKEGSVGRCSPFLRKIYPVVFVKSNIETSEPLRDDNGFCIPVKHGEPGLLLGAIRPNLEFDGYKGGASVTNKKLVRNVVKQGDCYFNSGDVFVADDEHFLYFHDRIGDTFRWKGENVSTIEVSNILCEIPWIHDANVYGVAMPGHDGRAGMASLMIEEDHGLPLTEKDLAEIYSKCEGSLPSYARPRFLRVQPELTRTETSFKNMKMQNIEEGFDPGKCHGDPLYFMDSSEKCYVVVDKDLYERIVHGGIKL